MSGLPGGALASQNLAPAMPRLPRRAEAERGHRGHGAARVEAFHIVLSPRRLASGLDRGEAAEPGHVSWPQAEAEHWPQSHTGQAQLCPLRLPEQVEGKAPAQAVDPPFHSRLGN